jgi:alpha-tubulin suppressor-like RCC1 family protein
MANAVNLIDGLDGLATGVIAIAAGGEHALALRSDGSVVAWGSNRNGKLGDGTTTDHLTPVAVAGGLRFRQVSASGNGDHTCGLVTDNRVYCWGLNSTGALGDGTTTRRLTPVAVAGGRFYSQLSAGASHTCGKTAGGVAYCWGDNLYGQLGDGTMNQRLKPVPVAGT